jgi:glycosyltransferase involved in cell wall biosynthesis/GT2 family glycosyltransferase
MSGQRVSGEPRPSGAPPSAAFAVNGRFLTQPVTGVQRYARNVVAALDRALGTKGEVAPLIAPPGAPSPGLAHMPLIAAGPGAGHAWEQGVLPARWPGRLLNLCNAAPAAKADQVVCLHDVNVLAAPDSYSAAFRAVYGRLQPLLARRAARIATVSHAAARQLARHLPIRAADVAVLPNGHEHALEWDPARARIAPEKLVNLMGRERPFALALGSRARHKNLGLLATLAPAFEELGLDIVVAGGGGAIFAEADVAAAPNILQIGRVEDDDLAWLLDRAAFLAFPSLTEGFGLPILEAMARGCPVISSDRASMPEVCGDAALMASPADPAAWTRHAAALAASPALRADLAGRGRERARLFSWKDTAEGYLALMGDPAARLAPRHRRPAPRARVAVAVATLGRPAIVSATIRRLVATQTVKPVQILISCPAEADAGDLAQADAGDLAQADAGDLAGLACVEILAGPAGLPAQRNRALKAMRPDIDVLAFFDDDFVAGEGWLEAAAEAFADEPDLVAFTGRVLADGVTGPGIAFEEAARLVEKEDHARAKGPIRGGRAAGPGWAAGFSPYGCNMAFRASAIRDLGFDERLVLYGWLEDRDFGAALARRGGLLVRGNEAHGVHMGVKGGRVTGDRLGYSQVVNPVYMIGKGTMTLPQAAGQMFRNVASNLGRWASPEPFIDRRGRLRGNLIGLADMARGRVEPERAAQIRPKAEA